MDLPWITRILGICGEDMLEDVEDAEDASLKCLQRLRCPQTYVDLPWVTMVLGICGEDMPEDTEDAS